MHSLFSALLVVMVGVFVTPPGNCYAGDPPPSVAKKKKANTKPKPRVKTKPKAKSSNKNLCKGKKYKTCWNDKGCGKGNACQKKHACVPSMCLCNPKSGHFEVCTQDCHKVGLCVKKGEKTPKLPKPKLFRNMKEIFAFQCIGRVKGDHQYLLKASKKRVLMTIITPNGQKIVAGYTKPHWVWDGHVAGLVTAKGLSISYQSHYGCIRNVSIAADFRFQEVSRVLQVKPLRCVAQQYCN